MFSSSPWPSETSRGCRGGARNIFCQSFGRSDSLLGLWLRVYIEVEKAFTGGTYITEREREREIDQGRSTTPSPSHYTYREF
jgi:hypothetical protein